MRLHLSILFASLALTTVASADERSTVSDAPKQVELQPGVATPPRPGKVRGLFSTQAQLFVEQKEAPAASKTLLRTQGDLRAAPRVSAKPKD